MTESSVCKDQLKGGGNRKRRELASMTAPTSIPPPGFRPRSFLLLPPLRRKVGMGVERHNAPLSKVLAPCPRKTRYFSTPSCDSNTA